MNASRTTERDGRGRTDAAETDRTGTVGRVEHYSCGLVGLVVTAAALLFLYPALVAATRPLYLLSSVALVFVVITAWVLVWLSLELVWEWRTGRLFDS
jgi:hypothetical protein